VLLLSTERQAFKWVGRSYVPLRWKNKIARNACTVLLLLLRSLTEQVVVVIGQGIEVFVPMRLRCGQTSHVCVLLMSLAEQVVVVVTE
jgi:hypothetical protein